jgi:hypothetical protein
MYEIYGKDDSLYPTAGDGVNDMLVFTDPPADGAKIEMKVITGSIYATIAAGQIGTAELQDNAVTLAKINIGAGDDGRVMVFDVNGDPTGRQLALDDIYDAGTFDPDVLVSLLSQIDLGMFTKVVSADVDLNNRKITTLAQCTDAQDAAHKDYVDGEILDVMAQVNLSRFRLAYGSYTGTADWWSAGSAATNIGEGILAWRPDVFMGVFEYAAAYTFSFWALRRTPGDQDVAGTFYTCSTRGPAFPVELGWQTAMEDDWSDLMRLNFRWRFPVNSSDHYFQFGRTGSGGSLSGSKVLKWMAVRLP